MMCCIISGDGAPSPTTSISGRLLKMRVRASRRSRLPANRYTRIEEPIELHPSDASQAVNFAMNICVLPQLAKGVSKRLDSNLFGRLGYTKIPMHNRAFGREQ